MTAKQLSAIFFIRCLLPWFSLECTVWLRHGATHRQLAAIGLLVNGGEAGKRAQEPHDALLLSQRAVLLKRLLDHLPELLGLFTKQRQTQAL